MSVIWSITGYGSVVVNIVSSLGLITLNKWLFQLYEFHFALTLSWLHFWTTLGSLYLMRALGYLEIKPFPWIEAIKLSGTCTGSIAFANLSLMANSMGVYQLAKMLSIPAIVGLEIAVYRKTFSKEVLASLAAATVGIGVAIGRDIQLNLTGGLYALGSVLCGAVCCIQIGSKQKEFSMDPKQLLFYQMHVNVITIIPLAMIFEDYSGGPNSVWNYDWQAASSLIAINCLTAAALNISSFFVIGVFSPVTYTVIGHFKTVIIIVIGCVLFGDTFDVPKTFGVPIVVVSIGAYLYLKHVGAKKVGKEPEEETLDEENPKTSGESGRKRTGS